ncbi:MAG: inorganic diphosphatase [Planctomycetes bacterium]|nr:inorganic diphosphatase [Planctomycetota bacterium]
MRQRFEDIPAGTNLPSVVNTIIEITKGRRNKFELDKRTGLIKLDRYLYSSSVYPGDYGFIPQSLADDGDALDILVMVNEPTFAGCLIETRVLGVFQMSDRGVNDYKVLGVPNTDPFFDEYRELEDVPKNFVREVEHFFSTYKQLEGAAVEARGWASRDAAWAEIRASMKRFFENQANAAERAIG